MKNKREYYPFKSGDWRARCKEVISRKYFLSYEVARRAKEEEEAAKLGEPVKFILKLMKQDPRRFKVSSEHHTNGFAVVDCVVSVDKKTGHKIKISKRIDFMRHDSGSVICGVDPGNPWLTEAESLALHEGISDIKRQVARENYLAKCIAEERRAKSGRAEVMKMYKQEMK